MRKLLNTEDVFYKEIYPVFSKQFLFGSNYNEFMKLVETRFILNSEQQKHILQHWNKKEAILSSNTADEVKMLIKKSY